MSPDIERNFGRGAMRTALGLFLELLFLLCLPTLVVAQENPVGTIGEEVQPRESTRRILATHKLKKRAKRHPAEAIRALDHLRTSGSEPAEEIALAIAEVAIRGASRKKADDAVGLFICAASETYETSLDEAAEEGPYVVSRGGPRTALGLHALATEGLIVVGQGSAPSAGVPATFTGPLREYELTWMSHTDDWLPVEYRYVGATSLDRKEKHIEGYRTGLGAPLVAVRRGELPVDPVFESSVFPIYRYYYPLTAVLSMSPDESGAPRAVSVQLVDPRGRGTFELEGIDFPLAVDLGAQFLVMREETEIARPKVGLAKTGQLLDVAGLYLSEPPSTEKTPVVLVHGLASDPITWDEALDDLVLDPELQRNYQFWLYAYPTRVNFPYAASLLRKALTQTMEKLGSSHARLQRTVLVGHSMGGLLVRLQVSDSANLLWDALFEEPPEEIGLLPEDVAFLSDALIFEPLPFVERVVFFSTPHRGTAVASKSLGRMGASLVSLPPELKEIERRVLASDVVLTEQGYRRGIPDSIQTLQPDAVLVQALDQIEIDSSVTYHSIVGDKGKGDAPDSSDGLVPYWSSHLDGAASELIVPSGHSSHEHEQGIAELVRILREHLEAEPDL